MWKYNYIILSIQNDYYRYLYKDIIGMSNVKYIEGVTSNLFMKIIRRIHTSIKINSIINLPFKNMWLERYINPKFPTSQNYCFIIFADWLCQNDNLISYIRNRFINSKIVIIYNDLIKTKLHRYSKTPLNIESLKQEVDLIISFDFKDSESYGINYYPVPYSNLQKYFIQESEPQYDIYFLGQSKNRLSKIINVYNKAISLGLKTNFIISGVEKDHQIKGDGLRYINGFEISYEENLKNISNCKCILEIMQNDCTGYSLRTSEAVCFNKILLTNNEYIKNAPFYDPKYIAYFKELSSIDNYFVNQLCNNKIIDFKYIQNLSPIKLLKYIESRI